MPTLSVTPVTDPERLAALRRAALLDTPCEEAFDRLTRLAATLLRVPVVLVSLVDVDRQFFKSAQGLPEPWAARRETPLSHSFCQHVVNSGEMLTIPDAREHPLVCDNLAVPELGVVAYAGVPLTTSDGYVLGSFCAIDTQPRHWTEDELDALRDLAQGAITEIELRIAGEAARQEAQAREQALAWLRRSEEQLQAVMNNATAIIYVKDRDGRFLLVNDHFCGLFHVTREQAVGRTDFDLFPPDLAETFRRNDRAVLETGEAVQCEEVAPHDDGPHTYISAKVPLHDVSGAVYAVCGISTDITVQKRLEGELSAALAKEHHIADALQSSFLLEPPRDSFPGLRLATCYEAAWEEASVGGDFFDAFALEGGRVALVVGDATGKGLAAAAHNAEVKYALRAFLREDADPAAALGRLNRFLALAGRLDADDEALLVLAVVVINPATGDALAACAGAEPPLLLRADGRTEPLPVHGLMLGISPDQTYQSVPLCLNPGDIVLMVTDGVTEARRGGNLFGYERMTAVARQSLALGSLREIGDAVMEAAHAFAGGALHDDACLLLAQRL